MLNLYSKRLDEAPWIKFKFPALICLVCVVLMMYCSNCGEKLPEDALFCPKCGTKTQKGVETKVSASSEEFRETLNKMGQELEKAFTIAAKEMKEAFQTARENIQKSLYKEPISCPNCGEKNPNDAVFCSKCGKKLKLD
jgi:uncharacterized membrane protein YvbJ